MTYEEMLQALCHHLENGRMVVDYDDPACEENLGQSTDEKTTAPLAREWASRLLVAAEANGMNGCRLCRS